MINKWKKFGPGYHEWQSRDRFREQYAANDKNVYHLYAVIAVICHGHQPADAAAVYDQWAPHCRPGGVDKPNLETFTYKERRKRHKKKKDGGEMLLDAEDNHNHDMVEYEIDEDEVEILNSPKLSQNLQNNDNYYKNDEEAYDGLMALIDGDEDDKQDGDGVVMQIHSTVRDIFIDRLGPQNFDEVVSRMNLNIDAKYIKEVNAYSPQQQLDYIQDYLKILIPSMMSNCQ